MDSGKGIHQADRQISAKTIRREDTCHVCGIVKRPVCDCGLVSWSELREMIVETVYVRFFVVVVFCFNKMG